MSASKNTDAELAYGAGQLNPGAALNPGLVYDAAEADYVSFLCGQGYDIKKLKLVTGDSSSCSNGNIINAWDLNYPSFALSVNNGSAFFATFNRTVTNVGSATASYTATVQSPSGLKIGIEPSEFSFKSLLEKQSFMVKIEGVTTEALLSASIVLSNGVYNVRSPIVVYTIA